MEPQPKIIINLSPLDKSLELASKICLLLLLVFSAYAFIQLPAIIPIHFNAAGKADNYGSKTSVLFFALVAVAVYLVLSKINKYPHRFNYLVKITTNNAQQQYAKATRLLRLLKLFILMIFTAIILATYLTSIGVANGLGTWFLPCAVGLLSIPTLVSIGQLWKKKNVL